MPVEVLAGPTDVDPVEREAGRAFVTYLFSISSKLLTLVINALPILQKN